MAQLGADVWVISVPAHMYMYWAGDFGVRFAQVTNDELSAYCAEDPEHFLFWAHIPMAQPDLAVKELERAVTELGAVGFGCGGANFGGLELHDEAFYPLWEKVIELGVPIFVHGYNQSVSWGDKAMDDPFDTTSILGMCYDEAKAFWNLVNGGVLDRYPDLRVYITHAGGFVPYQLQRFAETNKTMVPDSKNQKPVLEYMENFYFDPLTHTPAMRRAIVEDIGVDQLLYGSNFMGSDTVDFDLTEGIGLSDEDREKIRSGNAIKLLKLEDRFAVNG
jgi:aminocarboxymuconate-semialdehyde decarboxylase